MSGRFSAHCTNCSRLRGERAAIAKYMYTLAKKRSPNTAQCTLDKVLPAAGSRLLKQLLLHELAKRMPLNITLCSLHEVLVTVQTQVHVHKTKLAKRVLDTALPAVQQDSHLRKYATIAT